MDISKLKVKSDRGYPTISILQPNLRDANSLMGDYAGPASETTAVMTYVYQSYIVAPFDEEIAKLLERIGIVEMGHHDLLGTMITELGGNPVFAANGRFWTGRSVNYSVNLKEMLINNIAAEEAAIAGYRATIACMSTEAVSEVLECIIADEEVHISAFREVLEYISFWK